MRLRILAIVILLSAVAAIAQTEKATLRGTVTDQSGAVVPGAELVVTDLATNVEARRASSDGNGNYEMLDLVGTVNRLVETQMEVKPGTHHSGACFGHAHRALAALSFGRFL